jgi:hypothetical protein
MAPSQALEQARSEAGALDNERGLGPRSVPASGGHRGGSIGIDQVLTIEARPGPPAHLHYAVGSDRGHEGTSDFRWIAADALRG